MNPMFSRVLGLSGLLLLSACGADRVVLLPSADGKPTAVVVRQGGAEQVLGQPYAGVEIGRDRLTPYQDSPEGVKARFGAALAAQPPKPESHVVYFLEGKDELTPASAAAFTAVREAIKARQAVEVVVVGHTDRVGSVNANDALSLKRAQSVKAALVAAGVPESAVSVAGRGERELLVPTEDEVAEARNRRVEITVR